MQDLARQIIAAQSHRRMIDPITFAKRRTPFLIERPAVPVEIKPVKKER